VIALDAGILACALNRFVPEHARASGVVEEFANGATPWAIPWGVADAFLRNVTHPHAVVRPLQPADAWRFLELLRASPSLRMLGPTEHHGEVVAGLLAELPAGAGVPRGLATAAVLREHGVRELLSSDRGMRRFAFLTVRDPLHGPAWSPLEAPVRRYRRLR
jgi:predicted nucleic acid-binding protein